MDSGGVDMNDVFKMLIALIFVVALMGGLSLLIRRLGLAGAAAELTKAKRLKVTERLMLDTRRQAILLARDGQEHLVILGPGGETVIEHNITPPLTEDTAHAAKTKKS